MNTHFCQSTLSFHWTYLMTLFFECSFQCPILFFKSVSHSIDLIYKLCFHLGHLCQKVGIRGFGILNNLCHQLAMARIIVQGSFHGIHGWHVVYARVVIGRNPHHTGVIMRCHLLNARIGISSCWWVWCRVRFTRMASLWCTRMWCEPRNDFHHPIYPRLHATHSPLVMCLLSLTMPPTVPNMVLAVTLKAWLLSSFLTTRRTTSTHITTWLGLTAERGKWCINDCVIIWDWTMST